jgi:hypothetical protein
MTQLLGPVWNKGIENRAIVKTQERNMSVVAKQRNGKTQE